MVAAPRMSHLAPTCTSAFHGMGTTTFGHGQRCRLISNKLFIVPGGQNNIFLSSAALFNVTRTSFNGFSGSGHSGGGNGVIIGTVTGRMGGAVTGNVFYNFTTGVWL